MSRVMTRGSRVLSIVIVLAFSAAVASASSITVYGTGVDNNGNCLAGGSIDPHYMITAGPGTENGPINAIVVDAGGLPCGTVAQSNSLTPGGGVMTYTTTFDLSGYDPASASIAGTWDGDDSPVGVYLNGQEITWTWNTNTCCYFWGDYSATSGFVAGVNTLSFSILQNDNWYDYARIGEGTVTVQPLDTSAVPEPSSFVLLFSGIAGSSRLRGRKKHTSV